MTGKIIKKIFGFVRLFLIKLPLKLLALATPILFFAQTNIVSAAGKKSFWSFVPGYDTIMSVTGEASGIFTAITTLLSPQGLIGILIGVLYTLKDMILGFLVGLAGWFFDESLKVAMTPDLSMIEAGWSVSLAFANNFFIFILLGIAVATILGFESFNYKKMLPKFILVILLINFSMVIGGLIMDTTNFFGVAISNKIFTDATSAGVSKDSSPSATIAKNIDLGETVKSDNEKFNEKLADSEFDVFKEFDSIMQTMLFSAFAQLVTIFVFLGGAAYLLTRTFWIWFLLMISPLAWLALLIPGQEQHWKKWWSKFIAWSLFLPGYVFFLYLGMSISKQVSGKSFTASLPAGTSSITLDIARVVQVLVIAFVMLMGTQVASALGVNANNFITNYAGRVKGAAAKKFKDMRGKSAFSAENIGERFGRFGAAASAPLSTLSGGRFGTGRGKEMQGRLELDRQKQQQEKMEQEKLRHVGQMAGMDETQKRQYLMNQTQSARNGTGPTSLGQAAAINMLMEDKVAMENVSETAQGYMRQAVAAAKSSTQSSGINVGYTVTGEMAKKMREVQERASKTQVEANKENIEREMVSLASEDMTVLYQMAQNAISTNSASARDVAAMKVMQDRKAEASLLLSRVFATPEERVKFWSNAKLGVGAGEEGQSTTQYIR